MSGPSWSSPSGDDRPILDRPILVATDGRPHADTAMIAAAFIAGRVGGSVQVFSIVERVPLESSESLGFRECREPAREPACESGDPAVSSARSRIRIRDAMAARRSAVQSQIALTVGAAAEWPVVVDAGPLGQTSAGLVRRSHAQLMVIGQCRERRVGAPAGACHATWMLTQAEIPIYIAAPTLRGIARRVVVAMDFSVASLYAARTICQLSAPDATVYVVHTLLQASTRDLSERRYRLRDVAQSLRASADLHVEPILLLGAAAPETMAFADGIRADVIACGAASVPALPSRSSCPPMPGHVTRELIRRASCSLLIAPSPSVR